MDLDAWLSGGPGPRGLNPLPDPEVFARGMASLGIGDRSMVVAYDDAGGVIAARLVWMLRALGKHAALLDGGLGAWAGRLETAPVEPPPAPRPRGPRTLLVQAERLKGWDGIIVDARDANRFEGTLQVPTDPRPGHIPGAVNVPCRENLDTRGRLRPIAEVRAAFACAGIEDGSAVVSYCGSGITACHNLLVLERAGLGRGRPLYQAGGQNTLPARRAGRARDLLRPGPSLTGIQPSRQR